MIHLYYVVCKGGNPHREKEETPPFFILGLLDKHIHTHMELQIRHVTTIVGVATAVAAETSSSVSGQINQVEDVEVVGASIGIFLSCSSCLSWFNHF